MAQYDVDLRDYWRIIRKRKFLLTVVVLLAGGTSYFFASLKEPAPLYEAMAAVKIKRATNMADFITGAYWFQEENMETHAYTITSFPVLALAAKELGWIEGDPPPEEIKQSQSLTATIQRLKSMTLAAPVERTNIINIRVISDVPHETAIVANAFCRAYRDFNIRENNRQTFETKEFIENQLLLTSERLKKAEESLRGYKEKNKLILPDAQTRNILDRMFAVEAEYEEVMRKKRQTASQLELIRGTKSPGADFDGAFFFESEGAPAIWSNEKLRNLITKRETLLIDFTEKHPEIIELNSQIQGLLSAIKSEMASLLKDIDIREAQLAAKLNELREENKSIPRKTLELARLERDVGLQSQLYAELKTKHQETLIKESGKVEEVIIVKPAVTPTAPFNVPSKTATIISGLTLGLIIGVVFVFLAEVLDTSIGTIEDVESLLQVPVLGIIPSLDREFRKKRGKNGQQVISREKDLIAHFDPKSQAAEAFRALRTNLQFMSLENKRKTFLMTSSFLKEGKTFTVVNLAVSLAQAGNAVLLVEGDLRKPVFHKIFGLPRTPGLTDFILGNAQADDIIRNVTDMMLGDMDLDDILKTPGIDNLRIVTAGTAPPNPAELLRSHRVKDLLDHAGPTCHTILLDAPPVLPVADAAEIAPLADGTILVYTVGKIGRGVLKRAKSTLENINADVLGVVLNGVKPDMGPDYYRYHAQYYYGPGKKGKGAAS